MMKKYEIKIRGCLSQQWSDYFDGIQIRVINPQETILYGWLPDQAALHGILMLILNLGLELVSLNRVDETEGITNDVS